MDRLDDLSDKDLQEFKEIFDLVDTDHTGVISLQELRKLMAALHLRPTEQELEEIFEEAHATTTTTTTATSAAAAAQALSRHGSVASASDNSVNNNSSTTSGNHGAGGGGGGAGASRTINFTQFATIMARRVQSEYSAEQLRSAFQLFESPDMPEGFVSTSVLAHALMTYGSQHPSEEEVDRLIAAVDPERTGKVNYYDFVDMVTN